MEFQSTNQSKLAALRQLLHSIALAEESISPFCDRILSVLEITLFSFDEKEFIECSNDIATALGIAVDSRIYIPLLLKHLQNEVAKSSLKSLRNVLVACLLTRTCASRCGRMLAKPLSVSFSLKFSIPLPVWSKFSCNFVSLVIAKKCLLQEWPCFLKWSRLCPFR